MDTPRSKLKVIKVALKIFCEFAWETQSAEFYSIVSPPGLEASTAALVYMFSSILIRG